MMSFLFIASNATPKTGDFSGKWSVPNVSYYLVKDILEYCIGIMKSNQVCVMILTFLLLLHVLLNIL